MYSAQIRLALQEGILLRMTNLGEIPVRDLLRQCRGGTDKACSYSRIDMEFDVI